MCAPLTVEPFAEVRDEFRNSHIVPTMVVKVKEGLFKEWLEKFEEKFEEFECLRGEEVKKKVDLMVLDNIRRKERKAAGGSRKRKR